MRKPPPVSWPGSCPFTNPSSSLTRTSITTTATSSGRHIIIPALSFLFVLTTMPNKYSHALVLSHYESRGLISFPHRHKPRPSANAEPLHSEPNRHQSPTISLPSSPPRTPLPPLPPLPSTAKDGDARPSSHRSTPSTITEIYAPQPSAAPLHPSTLPSKPVPQSAQTSPTDTKGNSLTSEVSSLGEATPRTSVSSGSRGSTRKDAETGNGRVSRFQVLARPTGANGGPAVAVFAHGTLEILKRPPLRGGKRSRTRSIETSHQPRQGRWWHGGPITADENVDPAKHSIPPGITARFRRRRQLPFILLRRQQLDPAGGEGSFRHTVDRAAPIAFSSRVASQFFSR